jgi:hypothetical protein
MEDNKVIMLLLAFGNSMLDAIINGTSQPRARDFFEEHRDKDVVELFEMVCKINKQG